VKHAKLTLIAQTTVTVLAANASAIQGGPIRQPASIVSVGAAQGHHVRTSTLCPPIRSTPGTKMIRGRLGEGILHFGQPRRAAMIVGIFLQRSLQTSAM
jgi:hypothetical protein